jgi:hypothetical protein
MLNKINVLLCIFILTFFVGGQVGAAEGPYVSEPVTPHVFDGDLRDLPVADEWTTGDTFREAPILGGEVQGISDGEGQEGPARIDPLLEDTTIPSAAPMPAPILNFGGIGFTNVAPPDTNGDVGPNHYIQIVNSKFAIYNKSGTLLTGPSNINTLWSGFGGRCQSDNDGDPIALYDRLADRWLISQFVAFSNQCIAISRTPDPVAGGWYLYDFPTGVPNDYPKFGVWPDAYYMSSQRGYPGLADAWAFDRSRMLSGLSATSQRFATTQFTLPSDLDGATPPPAGAPNVFVRHVDGAEWGGADRLELRAFHVDWVTPANSTFTALPDLNVAAFDRNLCSGYDLIGACIPQPGTTRLLSSITAWLMYRLQYRNFGTHETLVVNHTVDAGVNHAGIRWYELRKSGANWSIFQQGTHSPDLDHRWMGSIAMDGDGNMALGYSVSNSTLFPAIRYAGRLATDPLGTLPQTETTLFAGPGSQTWTSRWGDYSSMNVDPVDDCTFWYTQEYVDAAGNWQTRIGTFKFPSCAPSALGPFYVQFNENTDCYEFYLDAADISAWGNINVYPAIFSGMLWYYSAAYWEIGVGWDSGGTHYLTVFFNNNNWFLYTIDGGPDRQLINSGTWSAANGCAVSDGGNTAVGD